MGIRTQSSMVGNAHFWLIVLFTAGINVVVQRDVSPVQGHRKPFHGKKKTCGKKKFIERKPVRITPHDPRVCWGDHQVHERKNYQKKELCQRRSHMAASFFNFALDPDDIHTIHRNLHILTSSDIGVYTIFNNSGMLSSTLWAIVEQPDDVPEERLLRQDLALTLLNDARTFYNPEACSIVLLLMSDLVRRNTLVPLIKNMRVQKYLCDYFGEELCEHVYSSTESTSCDYDSSSMDE